jgi:hypothetical protein
MKVSRDTLFRDFIEKQKRKECIMFLNILILSIILVAFTMLALGVKLLFDKDATFTHHSCALEDEELNNVGGCLGCQIKDIANCTEKKE